MTTLLQPALRLFVLLTLVTGVVYPFTVAAIAQAAFPTAAQGSLIHSNGKLVGSSLIGQPFTSAKYVWGRLSATTPTPYNAAASGGSNLAPTNPALVTAAQARIRALHEVDPTNHAAIPVDLVTSSASGLDPEISPAAAEYQAPRIARTRGIALDRVRAEIARFTAPRLLDFIGEPRVNVLQLNLALDQLKHTQSPDTAGSNAL